jgi:hypothetical protein
MRANFDMVMLLALVHHLCLIERVPLAEVARLTASLARRWMLVEFVPYEDRMARQMPGVWIGDSAWAGYNKQIFEAAFGRYFRPVRVEALADSGRWLYVMERVQEKRI